MYCTKCGRQMAEGAAFCTGYGAAANGSVPARDALQGKPQTVSAPAPVRKKKISKGLLITLIALGAVAVIAAGIIVGGVIIGRIAGAARTLPPGKASAAAASASPQKSAAPGAQNGFKAPVPGEGESLYIGKAYYDEAETFKVAFILSADGSTVHDVTIYLENLKVQLEKGNTDTAISLQCLTETYSGSYPVGEPDGVIDLGKTKIYGLTFTGGETVGEIEYVYTHRNLNGGSTVDVPLGKELVEFKNETAADSNTAPAAEETPASEETAAAAEGDVAQFVFEDKTYAVSIGKIDTNSDGNTTIELCSAGIGTVLPFRNNKLIVPVQIKMVADGKDIGWKTVTTAANSLTFEFPTSLAPEQIILYPYGKQDDPDAWVRFDAATKRILDDR